MVSHNTTLVPSLGLRIGPACEADLSAGMRRERVSPQINKKERKRHSRLSKGKCKGKVDLYLAPSRETSEALRHGSHSITCKYTDACLYFVSVHQMAPPRLRLRTSSCSLLLIYLPRKDERLNRHGWLTYRGRFIPT